MNLAGITETANKGAEMSYPEPQPQMTDMCGNIPDENWTDHERWWNSLGEVERKAIEWRESIERRNRAARQAVSGHPYHPECGCADCAGGHRAGGF